MQKFISNVLLAIIISISNVALANEKDGIYICYNKIAFGASHCFLLYQNSMASDMVPVDTMSFSSDKKCTDGVCNGKGRIYANPDISYIGPQKEYGHAIVDLGYPDKMGNDCEHVVGNHNKIITQTHSDQLRDIWDDVKSQYKKDHKGAYFVLSHNCCSAVKHVVDKLKQRFSNLYTPEDISTADKNLKNKNCGCGTKMECCVIL